MAKASRSSPIQKLIAAIRSIPTGLARDDAAKSAEILFNRGNAEADIGNHRSAADLFEAAIQEGCVHAINSMAVCYDDGRGRRKSRSAALALYLRAARLGDVCSMVNLGVLYRDEGKLALSEKWFLRSVAAGDPAGAIELAKLQLRKRTRSAAILASQNLSVAAQGAANALLSEAEEEELERLQVEVEILLNK
jgi:TPR repeat protein